MSEPEPRRLSVLLVEDDAPTRERLASAIRELSGFTLIAAVDTCAAARAAIAEAPPDILLTDLGLPDGRGDALIAELVAAHPEARCLAVTVFADERTVIRAIEAGASGYLLKDAATADIGGALDQLAEGGAPLSPSIARYLLKRFRPSPAPAKADGPEITLTEREREVLTMVAKGFSAKECATLLGISTNTVTTHARKVYRKLSVSSRGEAVYEAVQLGLIDLDA